MFKQYSKVGKLIGSIALSFLCVSHAVANDTIKIGVPVGLSGPSSVIAPAIVQASQQAADEINETGGILGKKVEIFVVDDASGAAGAQKAFDSLVYKQKVNVIIGLETSAARNAALPIINRAKIPYLYTSFYEGKSCNKYMFANGWVPEQQVTPIVDHLMQDLKAKKFFLIGSDYAFGRGMLSFTKAYIEKQSGTVVGNEYLPMDGTDWNPILAKLQSEKPDAIITSTAGGAPNVTLTKQIRTAGINLPYANLALDEGTAKNMGEDAKDIFIVGSYLTNIDSPANKEFLSNISKKFGADLKTQNELSVPQYEAFFLYKAAVEKANSINTNKVIEAMPTVSIEGPRGRISVDKQHHASLTMYMAQIQHDGSTKIIRSIQNVDPADQCPNLK